MTEERSQVDDTSSNTMGAEETTVQENDVNVDDSLTGLETIEDMEALADELPEGEIEEDNDGGENPEVGTEEESEEVEEANQEAEEETEYEEAEDEPEKGESIASRYRVKPLDEQEAKALALKKRNPDLSLAECIARVSPEQEYQTEVEEGEEAIVDTPNSDALMTQIEELEAKELELAEEMDFVEATKTRQKIDKLNKEYQTTYDMELREAEVADANERQEFENTVKDSQAKAVKFYPDTADKDSPLTKRMIEIDQDLQELDDDLYHDPDKSLKLAQMAAKELGIAPNSNRTAVKTKGKSYTRPIVPAGGRQSTQQGSETSKLDKLLDNVDSLEDMEDLIDSVV